MYSVGKLKWNLRIHIFFLSRWKGASVMNISVEPVQSVRCEEKRSQRKIRFRASDYVDRKLYINTKMSHNAISRRRDGIQLLRNLFSMYIYYNTNGNTYIDDIWLIYYSSNTMPAKNETARITFSMHIFLLDVSIVFFFSEIFFLNAGLYILYTKYVISHTFSKIALKIIIGIYLCICT